MSESLPTPLTDGSPAGYWLYQCWVSLMENQSPSSAASFPIAACTDWDDEIKWETPAYCWCYHMTPKHEWQRAYVQTTRYKTMIKFTRFFRWTQCLSESMGLCSHLAKRLMPINICFVTGTNWPQDLKLLLWHVLWYHWFSAGFDWPSDSSLLWRICTCCGFVSIDKTLVSSSTYCMQGSGQAQGFAFSIRLPQRFRAS